MDEDPTSPGSEKPRFLHPDGCQDLIDALHSPLPTDPTFLPIHSRLPQMASTFTSHSPKHTLPSSVCISDPISVRDLAAALHLHPAHVVGPLLEFQLFAKTDDLLDFAMAAAVCAHYGV